MEKDGKVMAVEVHFSSFLTNVDIMLKSESHFRENINHFFSKIYLVKMSLITKIYHFSKVVFS